MKKRSAPYYVYILECSDGSLYTGVARDVRRRYVVHVSGRGAKYTASHPPVRIVYTEKCSSRSIAQKREFSIKSFSRAKKFSLIQSKAI
ncbi:MAG: hypothetical protein RIQ56_184 [Candidatus Parcubacteria bacterium]